MAFRRIEESSEITPEGCTLERFRIVSPCMDREIKAVAVLPPEYADHPDKKYPVLYTLHGAGAPYDTFAQMGKLRSEQKDKPFIFTCFDADNRSLYLDAPQPVVPGRGANPDPTPVKSLFTTFFFDEFVPAMDGWYRIDADNRAVTGFSMGGLGAFHYMLCAPGMFRSVSGLSSAYFDTADPDVKRQDFLTGVMGPRNGHLDDYRSLDHYLRLEKLIAAGVALPPIYQHCGSGDFLIGQNRKMAVFAKANKLDFTFLETEGGHDWKFWHPASVGVAEFHWEHFND